MFTAAPRHGALLTLIVLICHGGGPAGERKAGQADAKPVPVTVAEVRKMDVPMDISAFGQVVPLETVSVQARVATLVQEVKVKDGQRVKKGDLLFILDKAPFAAAVDKAKATLARDTALANDSALEDKRQAALLKEKAVSQDAYDSTHANYLAAIATREMSAADLRSAEINLGYCEIYSPLDGVIGRVEVKAGNLIDEGGKVLVTINGLSPIRASFFVAETRLAEVRSAFASPAGVTVFASPDDGGGAKVEGRLAFINNQVDPATGTITLEAEFANADAALWPGQYVRIVLRLYEEKDALVVPEQALHAIADGAYLAAVVGPDGTVDIRKCAVKRRYENWAIVASGLKDGERVVLDGYLRLVKGSKAEIRQPAEASAK